LKQRTFLNFLVGFAVGIAGGLIGLGGAELRLPYLVGVIALAAKTAVPVNLAVSFVTVVAALVVGCGEHRCDVGDVDGGEL
jgi:uncharacterized membrane protein YfcA